MIATAAVDIGKAGWFYAVLALLVTCVPLPACLITQEIRVARSRGLDSA